jgi:hypothetical protein
VTDAPKPHRSLYQIVPIGSSAAGFALKIDGVIKRRHPRALPLAAYADALLAGASEQDADYIARAVAARRWPPSYEERAALREPNERRGPSRTPFDHAAVLEQILGEADDLTRRRLKDNELQAPYVVLAVTPDGQVVLRSNVSPDVLRSFSENLKNVADELTAPPAPGDTTH